MTISKPAVLFGAQKPAYEVFPKAKTTAALEVVDLAASAGLYLEPHQRRVLEGALGERPDGKWASFENVVIEPRQNGKGGILEARQLAGLFLFGEALQTHTAHRDDTSKEHFRRVLALVEDTPDLNRKVAKVLENNNGRLIELRNGRRLQFKTRSKGSGRGFSGDVVYLDEAFWLTDLGSLIPTMSARPNPQLWYSSSAPLPRAESDILRRLCRRGRAAVKARKSDRLAYFEWCAKVKADPADRSEWEEEVARLLDDRRAWAAANPGLGFRLNAEFIESERDAMSTEDFARERLGIWPDFSADDQKEPPAIEGDDWRSCQSAQSEPVPPLVYAIEVSLNRKWSCIAVAGQSTEGGTHVEVGENHRGTGWVVERVKDLRDRLEPAAIVLNPSGPAGALVADFEREGIELTTVNGVEYAQACEAAHDAIVEHRWRTPGGEPLDMAVTNAVKRYSGDSWVFDRRSGVDISPLAAVTLAAWVATRERELEPCIIVT